MGRQVEKAAAVTLSDDAVSSQIHSIGRCHAYGLFLLRPGGLWPLVVYKEWEYSAVLLLLLLLLMYSSLVNWVLNGQGRL